MATQLISVIILIRYVYAAKLDIYTEKGSTAILLCGLRKSGEQEVKWSKSDGTILTLGTKINNKLPSALINRLNVTGNHSIGEYNLQIADVQSIDAGNYSCSLSINSELIELFIKVKLTNVLIDPSRKVEVENYKVQHFTCTAKSIPLAKIQWYLNSEIISDTSKRSTNDTVISTFEYVGEKNDSGKTVFCNATSDGTTLRSLNAILNITYGPGMSQTLNPSVKSLIKIKDEKLGPIICAAVCNPLCQYHWSKNGNVIEHGYRLFKQSLEKTDTGNYRCRAWNGFGNTSIAFTLTVNYGPEYTNIIPDNTFYTIRELSPLPIITCNTDCRPICNKYWVGPNNQVIQSNTLNKSSIQRKEAGTYTCHGNNTVGSMKSKNILVVVTYGASVISLEPDDAYSTVNESQEVNMTCHVDGVPKPKIVWTFASDVIRNQENKTNYLFTAHCEQTGNYTCTVNNNIAEANKTKEMFVQCYPRVSINKSTERNVGLEDDEGLNISVTLIAYPAPRIQWSYQNYTISSNNSVGIFRHITHLYKPIVDENHFGIYSLFTSNKMGNAKYDISVRAKRRPDPPVILSAKCALLTMRVFWNYSFNGGETQTFSVEAKNTATKEITLTEDKIYLGQNPLNTTVHKLRPGTLYDVVVVAKNNHGKAKSEEIANCTTDQSESEFTNITAVAAGAGTVSALIVLGIVIAAVIIKRQRDSSKKDHHDKESFQGPQNEEDDNEGLKNNPMYVCSGSDSVTISDKSYEGDAIRTKQRKEKKTRKDNTAIELGCVYENAEDFDHQGVEIYANERKGKTNTSEYCPQKNKDGLIYADLDLAPLSSERRFVIRGLEKKSSYAVIDLSKKADPLPSDEEENETDIEKKE